LTSTPFGKNPPVFAPPERRAGFTVVEMLVSITVLVLVIAGVTRLFLDTKNLARATTADLEVAERVRVGLDRIEAEWLACELVALGFDAGGWPRIVYRLPVDVGEDLNGNGILDVGEDANGNGLLDLSDGSVVDASGAIEWGCLENGVPRLDRPGAPHRVTLQYVQTGMFLEADSGTDVNGDGDTVDQFYRGSLVRSTSGGDTLTIAANSVLAPFPDPFGDFDGDGSADPIFELLGEPFVDADGNWIRSPGESYTDQNGDGLWTPVLRVHGWLLVEEELGMPHLFELDRSVRPRNPQPE